MSGFDFGSLKVAQNKQDVDRIMLGRSTEPGCLITGDWAESTFKLRMGAYTWESIIKPIATFHEYLEHFQLPEGHEEKRTYTITKGFTKTTTAVSHVTVIGGSLYLPLDPGIRGQSQYRWRHRRYYCRSVSINSY